MNKIFKKILIAIGAITLIITPFSIFTIIGACQKHIYSKTYWAALVDKVNLLENKKNNKKIILIGGSNIAFGFNSESLKNEFPDYEIVNFGLHAGLGTKIMIDLSKPYISNGDLVFIIPEIGQNTMYFNPDDTLKCIEDKSSIKRILPKDDRLALMGAYFNFVIERSKYKDVIEPDGVYQRKNFNEYGDIKYDEKDEQGRYLIDFNRMKEHYLPASQITFEKELDNSFILYLNEFNEYAISKGASCYYDFPPINHLSVISKSRTVETDANNFYNNLKKSLSMKVIGNPLNYIIDAHYFYDTNYHLNSSGKLLRTRKFAIDVLKEVFGSTREPTIPIPPMPEYII